jgi:hypothetical protein
MGWTDPKGWDEACGSAALGPDPLSESAETIAVLQPAHQHPGLVANKFVRIMEG